MAEQVNMSTPPFYEGWLHKRGEKNVAWKSRYFVLKDDTLSYFTNPHADKPQGQISLDGGKILYGDEKLRSKFGFMISTPDSSRLYIIRASFEEERREWLSMLEGAIEWCAMKSSSNRTQPSSTAVNQHTKSSSTNDSNPYQRYFDMSQRVRLLPSVLPSSSQRLFMQQCGIDDSLASWRQPNSLLGLSSAFGSLINSSSLDKCMLGDISTAAMHPSLPWIAMAGATTDPGIQLVRYGNSTNSGSSSLKSGKVSPRRRESHFSSGNGDSGERGSIVGNITFRKNTDKKSVSSTISSATPFIGFNDEELSDDPGNFSDFDSDSDFSEEHDDIPDEHSDDGEDMTFTSARGMSARSNAVWRSANAHRSQKWDVNYHATFDLLSPHDQQSVINPSSNQHKTILRSQTALLGNSNFPDRPFGAELLDAHVPVAKAMAWKGNDLLIANATNRMQLFRIFDENNDTNVNSGSDSGKSSFLSGNSQKRNSGSFSASPQHLFSFDLPPAITSMNDPWYDTTVSSIATHPTNTNIFAVSAKSTLSLYDMMGDSLLATSGIVASSPITCLDWCGQAQAGQGQPSFSTPSSFTFLSGQAHSALLAIGTASGSVKVIDSRVLGARDATEGAGVYLASRGTPIGNTDSLTESFCSNIGTGNNIAYGHRGAVRTVRWCPLMPYWLASAGDDGGVRLWDIRYPRSPIIYFGNSMGPVNSLSFSQSHVDFLTTGHSSGDICIWNMRNRPHMLAHRDTSLSSPIVTVEYTSSAPAQVTAVDASGQCKLLDMTPQFLDKFTWPTGEAAAWDMDVVSAAARVGMQLSGEKDQKSAISAVCSIFGATAMKDTWLAPFVTSDNDMDMNGNFPGSRKNTKSEKTGNSGQDDTFFSTTSGFPGNMTSPTNIPSALPTGKLSTLGNIRKNDVNSSGKFGITVSPPQSVVHNPETSRFSDQDIPSHPLVPIVLERFVSKHSSSSSASTSTSTSTSTSIPCTTHISTAYAAMSTTEKHTLNALCELIAHNSKGSIHSERLLFRLLYIRDFQGVHKSAIPLAKKMLEKGQLLRLTALLHRISHIDMEHNPLYNIPYWNDDIDILPGGRVIRKNKNSGLSTTNSQFSIRKELVSPPSESTTSSEYVEHSGRARNMSVAMSEKTHPTSTNNLSIGNSGNFATSQLEMSNSELSDPYMTTKHLSLCSSSDSYQQYIHRSNNFHWLLDTLCFNTPAYSAIPLTTPSKKLKTQVQLLRLRLTLHFLIRQHDWVALVDAAKNAVSAFAKNLTSNSNAGAAGNGNTNTSTSTSTTGVGVGQMSQSLLQAINKASDVMNVANQVGNTSGNKSGNQNGSFSGISGKDGVNPPAASVPGNTVGTGGMATGDVLVTTSTSTTGTGISANTGVPGSGTGTGMGTGDDSVSSDIDSEWQYSEDDTNTNKDNIKKKGVSSVSSTSTANVNTSTGLSLHSKLTDGIGSLLKHGSSLFGLGKRSRNLEEPAENPDAVVDPLVAQTLQSLSSNVLLSTILAILVHDHVIALKLAIELAWILRTSGNFSHFTPLAYALCSPTTYYFNSRQNSYGLARDQVKEGKILPAYTLDSDSETEGQELSTTALSRSGIPGATLMDPVLGNMSLHNMNRGSVFNGTGTGAGMGTGTGTNPIDIAVALSRGSVVANMGNNSGNFSGNLSASTIQNPSLLSTLGAAPVPTITSRLGSITRGSVVSTAAGMGNTGNFGKSQNSGISSGLSSPTNDFGFDHDAEIQSLIQRLRVNNEYLKQRQKKAKTQVPVQVKQRAQASVDRDIRSPRLVLDSLELLYEVFDCIKRDNQSADDIYTQINIAAGLAPNSTRISRTWVDTQIKNIATLPRWNPYREISVKPNSGNPDQPFISFVVRHPRHALVADLPRLTGNTAKNVMRIVESNSKGELLPSILHRLYIQALNEKEAFDRALYISSKLIKRYQGLPFAKAVSRFVDTRICGDVVQWIHDMSRRSSSAPWECDKVGAALCLFTNIVCSVEELPSLIATSGPTLYVRVCHEYLAGLQACLTDGNYVPQGVVASDTSALKQARQKDALARAQGVLGKLRTIISGPVSNSGKDSKDHSAQWGAFAVHINGIVKKLDQFVSNKGVKVTW